MTFVLYVIVMFGIICGLGLFVIAGSILVTPISDWWDKRRERKPEQPPELPPLKCPSHGLEHLCKTDPIDTAELDSLEKYLHDEDPGWLAKMNRRLKVK